METSYSDNAPFTDASDRGEMEVYTDADDAASERTPMDPPDDPPTPTTGDLLGGGGYNQFDHPNNPGHVPPVEVTSYFSGGRSVAASSVGNYSVRSSGGGGMGMEYEHPPPRTTIPPYTDNPNVNISPRRYTDDPNGNSVGQPYLDGDEGHSLFVDGSDDRHHRSAQASKFSYWRKTWGVGFLGFALGMIVMVIFIAVTPNKNGGVRAPPYNAGENEGVGGGVYPNMDGNVRNGDLDEEKKGDTMGVWIGPDGKEVEKKDNDVDNDKEEDAHEDDNESETEAESVESTTDEEDEAEAVANEAEADDPAKDSDSATEESETDSDKDSDSDTEESESETTDSENSEEDEDKGETTDSENSETEEGGDSESDAETEEGEDSESEEGAEDEEPAEAPEISSPSKWNQANPDDQHTLADGTVSHTDEEELQTTHFETVVDHDDEEDVRPTLDPEQEKVDVDLADWCGVCQWKRSRYNCDARVKSLYDRFEVPPAEAKTTLMKQGHCPDERGWPEADPEVPTFYGCRKRPDEEDPDSLDNFCGHLQWKGSSWTCFKRMWYLNMHYGTDYKEAMHGLMKQGHCLDTRTPEEIERQKKDGIDRWCGWCRFRSDTCHYRAAMMMASTEMTFLEAQLDLMSHNICKMPEYCDEEEAGATRW
eukprot:CAMPEP_0183719292 /NCGR_PEP_ID=MMETSP0737-20130205/12299_1 /TAXON_ID=385413 /ORGANISM="Thalassiosira miniscula, Strain CCMP1093" /LENGTH=650 /DNA_ID=CAMNT_0025949007 /DNA_START=140 /DNA_END=2092 /DNA_ORIENTATION=+